MPRTLTSAVSAPLTFLAALSAVGIWRWSWAGLHLLRALLYKRVRFPALRRLADRAARPTHLYFVVPSYRMRPEISALVFRQLFAEIAAYRVPASIVACITDPADVRLIGALFEAREDLPPGTRIDFLPQAGTGKRDAMADALRLIARRRPEPRSQVILMDGDSLVGAGCLAKACSVIAAVPNVGAVTTENVPLVRGNAISREWYRLRMAHRDNLMCSMSLSGKVLVLTGRFSVFRAELATEPDFIRTLRHDVLHHWRLGPIVFLTGDDKSTWFSVLRRGWNMLYVPDAIVHPLEELPAGSFFGSTVALDGTLVWKHGAR